MHKNKEREYKELAWFGHKDLHLQWKILDDYIFSVKFYVS